MKPLYMTAGLGFSDRVRPLMEGTVKPEGIDLNIISGKVGEIFWRMLKYKEFSLSEMSMAAYIIQHSRGNRDFIAIPVFPSRMFRHSAIYIRDGAGINEPKDLANKRIGVQEYQMTACIWVRSMLRQQYGVEAESITWFTGGLEQPGRKERIPLEVSGGVRIQPIGSKQTLSQMLLDQEIDAIISPEMPLPFVHGDPRVRRLYPDSKQAEIEYYRQTGIFPIMHILVMKREIYEAHPWAAKELQKAFGLAKHIAFKTLYDTDHLTSSVVWLASAIEEQRAILGEDFWPYGFKANEHVLSAFIDACAQQGLLKDEVSLEELFAPNTLDDVTFF